MHSFHASVTDFSANSEMPLRARLSAENVRELQHAFAVVPFLSMHRSLDLLFIRLKEVN